MNADEREELLARLLSGELSLDSEEARAAMQEDPTMADELEILRGIEADYRRLAALERDDLAAAKALPTASGEKRVAEAMRTFAQERSATVVRPMWRRRPLLIAAGLAIAAAGALWLLRPPSDGALPPILGRTPEGLSPSGEVDSFDKFEWTDPPRPGRWFQIRVTGVARDGRKRTLIETREADEIRSPWSPGPAARDWPNEIHWELLIHDGVGPPRVLEARAQRK
jgi:hypothetical protein